MIFKLQSQRKLFRYVVSWTIAPAGHKVIIKLLRPAVPEFVHKTTEVRVLSTPKMSPQNS